MKKLNRKKQSSVFSFRFLVFSWPRLLKTENRKLKTVLRYRKLLAGLSVFISVVALFGAWRAQHEAQTRLERERARLAREGLIPFELKPRPALNRPELQIWQDTRHARAVARFHDSYFVATDGGLLELSPAGAVLHHYTVLDGLPESDLTALAAWQGRLFIGTRTQGLADFDGARFASYRFMDRKPQAINALYADNGRLLIGTFAAGLIEFDGRQFKQTNAAAKSLPAINCLARNGARLYVGTFADGLWLNEAGRWLHFTTEQGLPSNRVVGIVADDARLFVATDFGLALAPADSLLNAPQMQAQVFQTIATLPTLASLQRFGQQILLCTDDGQLSALNTEDRRTPRLTTLAWRDAQAQTESLTDCHLVALDDELWLLTSGGAWRTNADAAGANPDLTKAAHAGLKLAPFMQPNTQRALASNVVSALALDGAGRLWVGSFRDGITLVNMDGRRLTQIPTEQARETNALVVEPNTNVLLAATSQGLVRFDAALHATHTMAADGLMSDAITHVALLPAQTAQSSEPTVQAGAAHHAPSVLLVCATSRGLSLNMEGHWRGLTTVQGLPSNSLYALLAHGRTLYVGTLGGLAQVEAGRVVRVFTDANSKLTHNWATALASAGERVFVGTYGGGVFELMPSGELQSFAHETGALVVNPNAMWSDGARLYAGTSTGAWVFDLHTQRWTHLQTELPAPTVLSITGDDHFIFFGTTNGLARIETTYFKQQ